MANYKNTFNQLSLEEQVKLHLAIQGKSAMGLDAPERLPSGDDRIRELFLHILDVRDAGISITKISPDLFTKNDFFFTESDRPLRGWKLDTVAVKDMNGDYSRFSAGCVELGFVRSNGNRIEKKTERLSDLSKENGMTAITLINEVYDRFCDKGGGEDWEDGNSGYSCGACFANINDRAVFTVSDYMTLSHDILTDEISEAYEEAVRRGYGITLDGRDELTALLPVNDFCELHMEDGKPVVYEFVAISRTRRTGELVALGHRYEDRDLPCATKSVIGCDCLSLNASASILYRLERILSEDYDREDRQ